MKETKFLGTLMPAHPDLIPIVEMMRKKYNLPEISPDDDPITEIYLGDEIIPLKDFHGEIELEVQKTVTLLPPKIADFYVRAKTLLAKPVKMRKYNFLSKALKKALLDYYDLARKMAVFFTDLLDQQFAIIADMLYAYILTGESEEIPNDWISKVLTITQDEDKVVIAVANQRANPDVIVQQFREELRKAHGSHHPGITKSVVNTAHYMRLQRAGKPWKYIVGEFIRLNDFKLPRDRHPLHFPLGSDSAFA